MVAGKSCDTNANQEIMCFAEKDLRVVVDYKNEYLPTFIAVL